MGADARLPFVTRGELTFLLLTLAMTIGAMLLGHQLQPPAWLSRAALAVHLVSLVVGFGAVLTVDWYGLLWAVRRAPLWMVLQHANRVGPLIWIGVAGLVLSGALLEPSMMRLPGLLRAVAVLGAVTIGILGQCQGRRMSHTLPTGPVDTRLSLLLAGGSQVCWWTAIVVGFLTHEATPG